MPCTLSPSPLLQRPTLGPGDEALAKEREVEMLDPEQRHQGARKDAAKEVEKSDRIPYPQSPILRPTGPGTINDPPSSQSSNKSSIGYAEYTFTKGFADHVGHNEIRQIFYQRQTQASQADLESQIEESRKSGSTGLDQCRDYETEIGKIIQDCNRKDPDPRFEYVIASIKSDIRRRNSGLDFSSIRVILKRQLRTGINMQGPFTEFSSIRLPLTGLIDVPYHCIPLDGLIDDPDHYNRTADPYSLSSESNHVRH